VGVHGIHRDTWSLLGWAAGFSPGPPCMSIITCNSKAKALSSALTLGQGRARAMRAMLCLGGPPVR
jgi:hypothetical protein